MIAARPCVILLAMLAAFAPRLCLAAEEQAAPRLASAEAGPSLTRAVPATDYRSLAHDEARRAGLPGEVADAVMAVESGYDPRAIGSSGEIGLMQVLPSTARMMGFAGGAESLAAPATNIHYGVTYLAGAWRLAGGDLCTAVMKYRAGHGETRFSRRSVDYCLAVRAKLAARGYRVTGSVPVATFGDPPLRGGLGGALASRCRRDCLAAPSRGPDFDAINARLDHLVTQASANVVRLR
ncbi:lytic transglycosylase domain-containing protein [Methylosinus sp. Sm6]|uniref:lytic transglycosylase domain-containing protein n=1 Tax=Methylosinus sp. Sm6 TaxID=2866948 RepID=UPI001C9957B8|nr:transglycosylase SLT domain-containing protein [Methylosinus sp. Sm6]MBY6239914.1 transglycosylase SLT domain-containing protein [Methylosinus sp. Sm6]